MPAQLSPDGKKLVLAHPKGSSTEILLYGATVISWKAPSVAPTDPISERLFLSSKAILDGTKAVRGGIPVVFPFFGPSTRPEHASLPQHGYARIKDWNWDGTTNLDDEAGVSIKLTLPPGDQVGTSLTYVVTLSEHQLSTDLHIFNKSSEPTECQALLHTYIRAPSDILLVGGLKGLYYTDKTSPHTPRAPETRESVDVLKFTDSVYEDGPGEYRVVWPAGGIKIKAIGMKDVVVWNPTEEAGSKLNDMEVGGWDHFVCVEPGYVAGWRTVKPGETWIAGQTLSVL